MASRKSPKRIEVNNVTAISKLNNSNNSSMIESIKDSLKRPSMKEKQKMNIRMNHLSFNKRCRNKLVFKGETELIKE